MNVHQNMKYIRFGDIVTEGTEKPSFHFLLKSEIRSVFMEPADFFPAWKDEYTFLKKENVTVWRAMCHDNTNYVSLGNVLTVSLIWFIYSDNHD